MKKKFEKFLWGFIVFGIIVFLFWLLKPVFALLGGSIGISYLLIPAVRFFTNRGFKREIAIGMVFTIIGIVFCLIFFFVITPLVQLFESQNLQTLEDTIFNTSTYIQQHYEIELPTLDFGKDDFQKMIEPLSQFVTENGSEIIKGLFTQGMGLVTTFVNLSLLPIFCFYFLRDWEKYGHSLLEIIPPIFHKILHVLYKEVDIRLNAFIRGQSIVCMIMASLYAIGLEIAGITAGFSIGVLAGILFIIPYFGTAVGIILGIFSVLIMGNGEIISVFLVFGIVQALESWWFTPYIVGDSVGLSPVVVMLSLLIGASLLGLWGIALAIPVTAILSVLAEKLLKAYSSSPIYKGETILLQYIKQIETIILDEQTVPNPLSDPSKIPTEPVATTVDSKQNEDNKN